MKRSKVRGREADAVSRYWRPRMTIFTRAGVTSGIKRQIRRRERREGRRDESV